MSYDLCLHVDANDPAVLAFAFVNARNYMNGLPGKEFELVLVANGPAVKLFVPAQAELQKTAEELMARGLKLRLCKNALDANKMTAADLWPGCEVVPAGLVEIVELPGHPWFVGVQFHPELKSRPNKAHPLFRDFIAAAKAGQRAEAE